MNLIDNRAKDKKKENIHFMYFILKMSLFILLNRKFIAHHIKCLLPVYSAT